MTDSEFTIFVKKTNSERKLHLSSNFKKDLQKVDLEILSEPEDHKLIQRAGHPRSSISPVGYINLINGFMKNALGKGYSSHSFRQGILTEMAAKGVNVKIMAKFVGHKSYKSTLGYITPTDEIVISSLIR